MKKNKVMGGRREQEAQKWGGKAEKQQKKNSYMLLIIISVLIFHHVVCRQAAGAALDPRPRRGLARPRRKRAQTRGSGGGCRDVPIAVPSASRQGEGGQERLNRAPRRLVRPSCCCFGTSSVKLELRPSPSPTPGVKRPRPPAQGRGCGDRLRSRLQSRAKLGWPRRAAPRPVPEGAGGRTWLGMARFLFVCVFRCCALEGGEKTQPQKEPF